MASPMRDRRAWPPDRDSDGETAAAFEATVAEIKKRVASSGEVLVSAKEDLNDHQRWLKAQAAAAQSDRERLGRLLHRQRQAQEAVVRRERKRAWRRAKLQAAAQSVKNAMVAVVFALASAVWRCAAATIAGLNALDAMAVNGLRWLGGRLYDGLRFTWRMLVQATTWAQRTLRAAWRCAAATIAGLNALDAMAVRWLGGRLYDGLRFTWRMLVQATTWAQRTLRAAVLSILPRLASAASRLRSLLAATASRVGPKVQASAPIVRDFLVRWFGVLATSTRKVSDSVGRWFEAHFPALRAKAQDFNRAVGTRLVPILSSIAVRINAVAPNLSQQVAEAATVLGTRLRGTILHASALLARTKTDADHGENAVSWLHRARSLDRSEMLILAGAVLLVCGALMLGGGLFLRAGAQSPAASNSPAEPIAWLFDHESLTRDERSVFAFVATPEGIRITGFAIGGVNLADHALDQVESVIKPDHQAKDIRLAMRVAAPDDPASEIKTFEPGSPGAIPSQGQFALLFSFPEEGGLAPDQVLATFGGVMLKVHYSVGGQVRSFIHYLSPTLLERQLAEITAEANGS
jgi:hypothetical protein